MSAQVLDYLERDVMHNIVALKMLQAHVGAKCFYKSNYTGEAVMILLEPTAFAYDREHYLNADCICIIASDHPTLTSGLLKELDHKQKVVFKLNAETDALEMQKLFDVKRVTSFLSFTDIRLYSSDTNVQISTEPSPKFFDWIATEGHTRDWLEPMLIGDRAFCCELYNDDLKLESVCFAFENYGQLWEIGGVYTPPASRGRGLATRTVCAAIAELQQRGKRCRYQVHENNQASIRVAEHIELELFLTITHWF
jgi:RimJ/RimL family protein N-acetyltransferase